MRIPNDIRKAVVFLGHKGPSKDDAFIPIGTGFFLMHEYETYLVTARHIAEQIGDDPYHIRLNHTDGRALNCYCDPLEFAQQGARWSFHEDPNVDVAVMPFRFYIERAGADFLILQSSLAPDHGTQAVECGDFCYVIGLFGLHPGKDRMMPVIHTGHIAMMSDPNERIPTQDWRNKKV